MTAGGSSLILAIDTATASTTVALTRGTLADGKVIGAMSFQSTVSHSRRLIGLVDLVFQETASDWKELEAIAVGLGPGSFTGLRIGLATARGFAAASGKKLFGISTLDCLACQCVTGKRICAVIDARKKQVYARFYRGNATGEVVSDGEMRAISPADLVREINEPVVMIGDGVDTYHHYWQRELADLVEFAPSHLHSPSAAGIGLLAGELLKNGVSTDIAAVAPLYVRASDAELCLVRKKMES